MSNGRTGHGPAWSIRDLVAGDLPGCAVVFDQAWRQAFPQRARRIDVAALREATHGEWMLVAARDGRVGGFVAVYPPERFIHHLYVDPALHGLGLGRRLLLEALRRLDGTASLKCELANTAALAFYRHLGWTGSETGVDLPGHPWLRLHSPSSMI